MRFSRFIAASAALMVAGGFSASAALAANPHFQGTPDYSIAEGAVTATGSIVGAGNQDGATIVLTAEAEVGCLNKPGKAPKGHRRSVSSEPQTFPSDANGRINFSVTTGQVDVKCPGKMTPFVHFLSATLTATVGSETLTDVHTFS
jgi:hypothetical protein